MVSVRERQTKTAERNRDVAPSLDTTDAHTGAHQHQDGRDFLNIKPVTFRSGNTLLLKC